MPLILVITLLAAPDEGRFFSKRQTDFWGTRKDSPPATWPEPMPAPVRTLLERPTPENAARYLEWQKRRAEQLLAAMRALEAAKGGRVLYYFTRTGCPFCVEQDKILAGMKGVRVERVSDPEVWKKYQVTATPTLVLDEKGRKPKIWRGLVSREQLEKEMQNVDR